MSALKQLDSGSTQTNLKPVTSTQDTKPNLKIVRRHGQAKRFLSTKNLSHTQWLQARQQGLGASDAAAAVGLNPYQSPLELWMQKTGRQPLDFNAASEEAFDASLDDSPLHWGTVLEPIVAEHYARKTGAKVRRVNAILQHAEHPFMLANLDRQVIGDDQVQILECKTTGQYGAKLWKDGVPEYVQLQVQHQLAVTGYQAADVAVLLAGQQFKVYRIERDEALIEKLIQLEAVFWQQVHDDVPPAADASASSARALQWLYPFDTGHTVDFNEDRALSDHFSELVSLRERIQALSELEAGHKHAIQQAMGDNSIAQFSQGRISWKKAGDSLKLDGRQLKIDHPALYEAYLKPQVGSRRFLVQAA